MTDLIVDGNSLWARCFFAVKAVPDEAERLFISSCLQFLDIQDGRLRTRIQRTLFGWDGAAKTEKRRKPKPMGYESSRRRVQEATLELFNTVHGFHLEFEADDVVATAAYQSTAEEVFVLSGDKDLMQLQGGPISYYCLNAKAVLPARIICQKFHVKRPQQVAIALAILGDRGDNISGIKGWGPKKVQALFGLVTPTMTTAEALEVVQRQVPNGLVDVFLESLDKTLLHTDVPDVPEPATLEFCDSECLFDYGLGTLLQSYEKVAMQYEGGTAIDDMIKGSAAGSGRRSGGRSSATP